MDKKIRKIHLILGSLRDTFRLLKRNKVGFAGFIILIFIILMSFIGPYIVPFDTTSRLDKIYVKPSWEHPLGTDSQGRDILAQIVHGGRDVLVVAFLTGFLSTLIAISLGSLSAFIGGRFDSMITSLADIVLTIPHFPLLSVLAAFVKLKNPLMIAFILALLSWPGLLRAVRAQVLSLKERDFIEAARALDLGTPYIVFSEILPNMMNYIVISFILSMTSAVYAQVGLILLGLVPLATHNWGVMINFAWTRGAIFYKHSIYYILSPIFAISLFQWSLVSFTRSLEEIFNPRLGQGA